MSVMGRSMFTAFIGVAAWASAACIHPFGCTQEGIKAGVVVPDSALVAFETSRGRIDVMVRKDWAPIGVSRFLELVNTKFFDDARFFRVLKGFVAQFGLSGDPKVTDAWGGRCLADEPVKHSNTRGTLTFAHAGPGTRSTQMFFNLKDNANLDGIVPVGFAPFAEVVAGMPVVDSLYAEYGEAAPRSGSQYGMEGPSQDSMAVKGNEYLMRGWPKLDYIKTARVVQQWPK